MRKPRNLQEDTWTWEEAQRLVSRLQGAVLGVCVCCRRLFIWYPGFYRVPPATCGRWSCMSTINPELSGLQEDLDADEA